MGNDRAFLKELLPNMDPMSIAYGIASAGTLYDLALGERAILATGVHPAEILAQATAIPLKECFEYFEKMKAVVESQVKDVHEKREKKPNKPKRGEW